MKIFDHKQVENLNHQKFMDYTRRLVESIFFNLSSFELENIPVFSSRSTDSITKVLTDVHKNFDKKNVGIMDHQKWPVAHKN